MPPDSTKSEAQEETEVLNGNVTTKEVHVTRSYRTSLPQVLATMAQSLLLFALGMLVSAPTIVVGALHNAQGELSLNDNQASWIGGILFIFQPVGSLLSGVLQDPLGRKKCMLLVNLPQAVAWILVYKATSPEMLYLGALCMGFTIGFLEAPTLSYVGEISQPHLRGTLASFTSVYVSSGALLMLLLGSVTDWRTAAAISVSVPIVTVIAISQVPESPVWLMMKGRRDEAMRALCWLRGWVKPDVVQAEYQILIINTEASMVGPLSINKSPKGDIEVVSKKPSAKDKLKFLVSSHMLRPLRLVTFFFFFFHCASMMGSRPFLIDIFRSLGAAINPKYAAVAAGLLQLVGSVCCMGLVRRLGRRRLSLISMGLCVIVCYSLAGYTLAHQSFGVNVPWVPVILICLHFFTTNLGIGVIPWTLLSEVFPSRGRGMGGGVSAAIYYFWFFLTSKTFLDLESLVRLSGVYAFYGTLGVGGIIFLYYCLPETEGCRLEDVEKLFRSKKKKEIILPSANFISA